MKKRLVDDVMNNHIDRDELGQRLRDARRHAGLTLKDLDQAAGLSATHISEIERGKTSPTIGALIRLAGALGKEASYFVEPEALPDVSIIRAGDRARLEFGPAQALIQTSGIPGGRLRAIHLTLDVDRQPLVIDRAGGSLGAFVLSGSVEVTTSVGRQALASGDSIYLRLDQPIEFAAIKGPAEIFAVSTALLTPGAEAAG